MPVYEEKRRVNGQKVYFIRCYVESPDGDIKQISRHNRKKWIGNVGKKLAQQEEIRLINEETTESLEKKKQKIKLCELKEMYLASLVGTIDDDTLRDKRTKLNHFCEFDKTNQVETFPNKDIRKITKEIYQRWKLQMKEKKYKICKKYGDKKDSDGYKYTPKTLNKIHNLICNMFDYAISEGLCSINPAKQSGSIVTPKESKLMNNNINYVTINFDEFTRLLEVCKDDLKYYIYFYLSFTRGPRIGEVRALRCCDFNYDKKQIMINHTMSKKNELKPPKTASSKAPLTNLDDELVELIQKRINEMKKQDGYKDTWYILSGGENPISSNALSYAKEKYFKLANIKQHMRPYDFRHSCATWLYSLKIPVTVISKILRHKNVNETQKTYIHLTDSDYDDSIKIITNIVATRNLQDQKQDQNVYA